MRYQKFEGYSGRFPNSKDIHEYRDKLINQQDLVDGSRRYPLDYHGLPNRAGHLEEIDKFDNVFFRLNKSQVEGIDPQIRILLEVSYEAVLDADLSLSKLKGTSTGVYVGYCFSDYYTDVSKDISKVNGYENVGSATSMSANKISYFFDITGPSFTVDTACSSSLVALDRACQDIENGICERAIVAGCSLNLKPAVTKAFQKYNMLSPTGTCHSFDSKADGYCRSESIVVIIIEKKEVALKSAYAKIAAHGINCNGYSQQGITFPSIVGQSTLINSVCQRYGVHKKSVAFIEAHGTGTTAGDNVEILALEQTYGDEERTIPIGAVKSNVGHAEGASGLVSVVKCLMMLEIREIIPNIHYEATPHEPILKKKFRVVTEREPLILTETVDKIAINNFGFGGVNAHVILQGVPKDKAQQTETDASTTYGLEIPYYVYGRSHNQVLNELQSGIKTAFYVTHLDDIHLFPFRGAISAVNPTPLINKVEWNGTERPALVYIFCGQGSQYKGMGLQLYKTNRTFFETIQRLGKALYLISDGKIELEELFVDGQSWCEKQFSSIGITAVQVGLVNMLTEAGFEPDFMVGHSMGEIGCAYADGCLTEEQAIYISYIRSQIVQELDPNTFLYDFSHPLRSFSCLNLAEPQADTFGTPQEWQVVRGTALVETDTEYEYALSYEGDELKCLSQDEMASAPYDSKATSDYVGIISHLNTDLETSVYTYRVKKAHAEEFEKKFPDFIGKMDNHGCMLFVSMLEADAVNLMQSLKCQNSCIACFNSIDGLTLSGPLPELERVRNYLVEHSIFHRAVDTGGCAYHSPLLSPYKKYLVDKLSKVMQNGIAKQRSKRWISSSDVSNEYCDAMYHAVNITGSVYFHQAVLQLPESGVAIEVGPNNGLLGQVQRSRPSYKDHSFPVMTSKQPNAEITFLQLQDALWVQGVLPKRPAALQLPYSTINPSHPWKLRNRSLWNHDDTWKIVTYENFEQTANNSIDNNRNVQVQEILYDLTDEFKFLLDHVIDGQALFPAMGHVYSVWNTIGLEYDIVIEKFAILRAINIEFQTEVKFSVRYDTTSGEVKIFCGDELVCTSFAKKSDFVPMKKNLSSESGKYLDSATIYGTFARYKYDYKESFQVLSTQSADGSYSTIVDVDSTAPSSESVTPFKLHWINYLDGMLQASIVNVNSLRLPTGVKKIALKSSTDLTHNISVQQHGQSSVLSDPKAKKSMYSAIASIIELETTQAPSSKDNEGRLSTVNSVRFVPYGVNHNEISMIPVYKASYLSFCHNEIMSFLAADESILIEYPHLKNLVQVIQQSSIDQHLVTKDVIDQPVFNITKDMYRQDNLKQFLINPLLVMSQHQQYHALYFEDILFSSSENSLRICVDIIGENFQIPYKVLEIGTGTGGAMRRILPLMFRTLESYTASDISVINTEGTPKGLSKKIHTSRWNINDPYPDNNQKFDVIFGSNSVHCAKDMVSTLTHISNSLVEGGFLLLEEYISELPIFLWGFDSFIWTTATDSREYGLWMTHEHWMSLFAQVGLQLIISFDNKATCLYLLRKFTNNDPLKYRTVQNLCDEVLTTSENAEATKVNLEESNMVLVGEGIDGVLGFTKCFRKEPESPARLQGFLIRNTADINTSTTSTDIVNAEPLVAKHVTKGLLTNVLLDEQHGFYGEYSDMNYKTPENWSIHIEKPGFLNTLYYRQCKKGPIDIHYVGLNFKDVMLSYGKLKLDSTINLGIEFSGYDTESTTRKLVMGIGINCLRRYMDHAPLQWTVPATMSAQDAATIPCVYATAYYCLDYCAHIQPNQSILIHAGAGGVGQAAIQICLNRGCKVFTTCSSSKRQFLIEKFSLPDNQIGNSREESFYDWIMDMTNHEGVDVVLNSLSEEKLIQSLNCVAKFGHFCEIGKYDIMQNNEIGLKVFENNISFHGVDISEMVFNTKYNKTLTELVQSGLDNGEIKPINIDSIYQHHDLSNAIRYMGGGQHTGKILIQVSDEAASAPMSADIQSTGISIQPHFVTAGVHIITGGLGGFGLELAEWLVETCGSSNVVLLGRSGRKNLNGYQERMLMKLGSRCEVVACDVTNQDETESVLKHFGDRVMGLWHLAMLLQDSLFKNMSMKKWKKCVDVKMQTALYLDRMSRALNPNLKEFVMFSSVSSLFGNAGQTNYGYANDAMEQLGYRRQKEGLPAKVICWGRIGNVGYISKKQGKVVTDGRLLDQSIDSCLQDLHLILNTIDSPVMSCYRQTKYQDSSRDNAEDDIESVTCLSAILRVLGLDEAKVLEGDSLTQLGVDSLQVVTIKSILKAKGVVRPVQDIYAMTVKELRLLG